MKTKDRIRIALDGNWCNDQRGELEEIKSNISLLKDLLSGAVAMLIDNNIIDMDKLKENIEHGWRLDND